MAAMEASLNNQPPPPPPAAAAAPVEKLNDSVASQLNLKSMRDRATNLSKNITRILEDLDACARTNTVPKWQFLLGQYSMVNLELLHIVEEIKKVSKAFVVYPRNLTADISAVLPLMLSSKLLPEMEVEDNAKREQLLLGLQSLPVSAQIERLKGRIDMIGAACESAEKVLADTRKAYGIGTRQNISVAPTLDKAQAAKIQEQENLLRAAVNYGEALRLPPDQRQNPPALPMHLLDVLGGGDGAQAFPEGSGIYSKNTPVSSSSPLMQVSGLGRSAASPGGTGITNFDNTTSPLPYANSPRSSANILNTSSPQQSQQQKQQLQQQQQQQQKLMQLPQHQQQLLAQQQFRQSPMQGLGQNPLHQMHDLQGQTQQKFSPLHAQHQMQFSPSLGHQQFQGRQLPSGHVGIGQNQLNAGSQMNRHLSQFSGAANSALFNAAQTTPNQMIPNMSATMSSQSLLPRMQFDMPGNNPQRGHASQILSDQVFNMGATNTGGIMPLQQQQQQQQQQHGSQGAFGNMGQNSQNLQSNMVQLQGTTQNHPNFSQQRQQNQQQ